MSCTDQVYSTGMVYRETPAAVAAFLRDRGVQPMKLSDEYPTTGTACAVPSSNKTMCVGAIPGVFASENYFVRAEVADAPPPPKGAELSGTIVIRGSAHRPLHGGYAGTIEKDFDKKREAPGHTNWVEQSTTAPILPPVSTVGVALNPFGSLDFSRALDLLKAGFKVRRAGWQTVLTLVKGAPRIVQVWEAQSAHVGWEWMVTQEDILANDWEPVK